MASSGRTPLLGLCDWEAADLPQRVDFNQDRLLMDRRLAELEGLALEGEETAARAWRLTGQGQDGVEAHVGDAQAHMETREREEILKKAPVLGLYQGNGQLERQVSLGFEPRFAVIWCVGKPPQVVTDTGVTMLYRDFCVPGVECPGSETYAGGLVVFLMSSAYNGFAPRLNENGLTYRYAAWV